MNSRARWVAFGIAAVGWIDSVYLTVLHLLDSKQCGFGNCSEVLASSFASVLGIPTAWFGVLFYSVMGSLIWQTQNPDKGSGRIIAAWWLSVAGVVVSVGLIGIQAFVIQAFCTFCLVSVLASFGLFGVLSWQVKQSNLSVQSKVFDRTLWRDQLVVVLTVGFVFFGVAYYLKPDQSVQKEMISDALVVDGQSISLSAIDSFITAELLGAHRYIHQIRLDQADRMVLMYHAKQEDLSPGQLIDRDVRAKTPDMTGDDVQAYVDGLKTRYGVTLNLPEPDAEFRVNVASNQVMVTSIGSPGAFNRIHLFFDYNCVYCRQAFDYLRQLVAENPDQYWVEFHHFPEGGDESGLEKAELAAAAAISGKFIQASRYWFRRLGDPVKNPVQFAQLTGLNPKKLEQAKRKAAAIVRDDQNQAKRLVLSATPTLVVNGVRLDGFDPNQLQQVLGH